MWTKSQGIWSIQFRVKGNRFILEVSPRFDMSDMDTPVDLDKIHEQQLFLYKGPKYEPHDDVFLGYYPDQLLASTAGANVFHYMNGKLMRPRPKPIVFVLAMLIAGLVLLVWPTRTQVELNTTTVQRTKLIIPREAPKAPPPQKPK